MYLAYYNLRDKPFQLNADLRYFWLGESGKRAFYALRSGVLQSKGIFVVTGDVGTGKTIFAHALTTWLRRHARTGILWDPDLNTADFYRVISHEFGLHRSAVTRDDLLSGLKDLMEADNTGRRSFLLVIEESQRIGNQLLEDIHDLVFKATHSGIPLNVCFVGQNELNDILADNMHRRFTESCSFTHQIQPFTEAETRTYICYRLKKAGASRSIFSLRAMREIHARTGGCPRAINVLCDQALMAGYRKGQPVIQREIIDQCSNNLAIADSQTLKRSAVAQTHSSEVQQSLKSGFPSKPVWISLIVLALALIGIFFLKVTPQRIDLSRWIIKNPVTETHGKTDNGPHEPTRPDITVGNHSPEDLNKAFLIPASRSAAPQALPSITETRPSAEKTIDKNRALTATPAHPNGTDDESYPVKSREEVNTNKPESENPPKESPIEATRKPDTSGPIVSSANQSAPQQRPTEISENFPRDPMEAGKIWEPEHSPEELIPDNQQHSKTRHEAMPVWESGLRSPSVPSHATQPHYSKKTDEQAGPTKPPDEARRSTAIPADEPTETRTAPPHADQTQEPAPDPGELIDWILKKRAGSKHP